MQSSVKFFWEFVMSKEANYKFELVGAMGMPISENPTGVMMEAAFRSLDLPWRYELFEVHPDDLESAIAGMRALNFKGMNFTIPHKVAVLKHLDKVSPDAAIIGAVNTVRSEGRKLIGENTDGKGFLRALEDAKVSAVADHVVILGAGGAARAISVELALAGTKLITIVNRSEQRGIELVDLLNQKTETRAEFELWRGAYSVPADTSILVHATSIGLYPDIKMQPDLDFETLTGNMVVCDVIPNPPDTLFLKNAREHGAKTLDGLGMLVHQGAIAFKMWTGHDAPTEIMHAELIRVFG